MSNKWYTLPTSTMSTQRGGFDNEPELVIRQPTTLEAIELDVPKPKQPFDHLEDAARGHLIAMIGEFLGTMMFLFFGYIAAQTGNEKLDNTLQMIPGTLIRVSGPSLLQISYISTVFGLSLAINVFIWYRVSGGMFNPSISIGLWLAGAFNWARLVCVIVAQCLGAIAAAGIVSAILPGPLQAENSMGAGVTIVQGLITELVLTSLLMMTILMLAVEKSRVSFMAPLIIGLSVLVIHLVGINVSGASVNPARSLGPAVVNNNYVPEFWIYFIGPTFGAMVAASIHGLLKALAYESANPGQDGDGMEYYRLVPPPPPPPPPMPVDDYKFKGPGYMMTTTTTPPRPVHYRTNIRGRKDDDERTLLEDMYYPKF